MTSLIRFLYPYIARYRRHTLISVLLAIPLAAIKAYQASLVKPIFEKGLSGASEFKQALALAGLLIFLGLLNYPCRFFHFYLIRFVVDKGTCALRSDLYRKFQKLPLKFFNDRKQGALLSNLMNDTQALSQGLRGMVDLVREPLTAFLLLGLALYRDWQLTLVIFIVAPLFIWVFQHSGKRIRRFSSHVQEELAHMTHNAAEGLSGQKIFKAFNLQHFVAQRFDHSQNSFLDSTMKTTFTEENAHPLVELVGALAFSGVIVFAHYRISHGYISQGDFISFVTALALLMDPIRKYSQANLKLNQAQAAMTRIEAVLKQEEEVDQGSIDQHTFSDKIEIKNVSFTYGEGMIIKNLSLTISKGEKVALIGPSGSGKSTLVNLLLRFYPLSEGEILIDGIALEKFSLNCLRSMFGLVSQDVFLFNDTITENLRVGSSYSEEKIKEALVVAGAKKFVDELPRGKETLIGDRGVRLSGGQCQRLTIARAFLKDASVLLFDEATSALDNESEKLVQEALERLAQDKTVLAVAHRLSTIKDYDKIIVLHRGEKIEEGTHRELMAREGEYAKLSQLSSNSVLN